MNFRQIISILLAALSLITSSRGIICWLEYKINHDYIVKMLCVEKEEPINCCQGSCHLKTNLESEESGKKNNDVPSKIPPKIKFDENSTYLAANKTIIKESDGITTGVAFQSINNTLSCDKEPPSPPPKYQHTASHTFFNKD